ncbi:MAG: hypothetical protein LLG97_05295 [Deltaproteobacteria bacterium]|nr:hypothetical protein [Deltaproteobacteria bacterium]
MPSIKFNLFTREIEMRGPESFIESNFDKIRDLWIESFGVKEEVKEMMLSRRKNQEPMSAVETRKIQEGVEIEGHPLSAASRELSATGSPIPRGDGAKRPPLRKYIRKEGQPGQQRTVVEVAEQKPKEISIASLKEKFGLSESKIGGIMRDAEKLGKIKRGTGGAYSWG